MAPSGLLFAVAALNSVRGGAAGYEVSRSPPLGWNSWDTFEMSVSDKVLRAQAQAMHDSGLQAAGYKFVSSDDSWMLGNRDAEGHLIPDPAKFPNMSDTVAFIHSLNLSAGLYTARGTRTCCGFAGACGYEASDAAWYAGLEIDLLKDDACSNCGSASFYDSYGAMARGLAATGRPIVLCIEGDPSPAVLTLGGYGQTHRVGHDLSAHYRSMLSSADIGSGLWPYAHNATTVAGNPSGYFNDLDMVEVGNGEFSGPGSEPLSQTHMSLWALMKSPIILGIDLTTVDAATLAILGNPAMLAVNQDALGLQGRRVSVQQPENTTLGTSYTTLDSVAVLAPCDATDPTQTWTYVNETSTTRNLLFIAPCTAGNLYQVWNISSGAGGGTLHNVGTGECVDASIGNGDPAMLGACAAGPNLPANQTWRWDPSSNHIIGGSSGTVCLASDNFEGPDVELAACKTPGKFDSDQQFLLSAGGLLYAQLPTYGQYSMCLTAAAWPAGGRLATVATPAPLCLYPYYREEGGWLGVSCSDKAHNGFFTITQGSNGSVALKTPTGPFLAYNTQEGASGPWPHSRYVMNGGPTDLSIDLPGLLSPAGALIQASDTTGIINDDLVGNVTLGGSFCLALRTAGMLETWVVPLAGGAWAAVLVNRSPSPATMTLAWADLRAWAPQGYSVPDSADLKVTDVWSGSDEGVHQGSYTPGSPVSAHGVSFVTLAPPA